MQLEISKKHVSTELYEYLNNSLKESLNIYDNAILKRKTYLNPLSSAEKKPNEYGIIFNLSGELKGLIVCLVEVNMEDLKNDHVYFQSLFLEAMNILLGNILTNLEDHSGIMSMISSPKIISVNDNISKLLITHKDSQINANFKYDLLTNHHDYKCRILILADKVSISEV